MINFNPNSDLLSALVVVSGADIAGQLAWIVTDNQTGKQKLSEGGIDLIPGGNTFSLLTPVSANDNQIGEVVLDFTSIDDTQNGNKVKVHLIIFQGQEQIGDVYGDPVTVDGTGQVARALILLKAAGSQPA